MAAMRLVRREWADIVPAWGYAGVMGACMRFSRVLAGLAALLWVATFGGAIRAEAAPPPLSLYGQLPGFEMAAVSASGNHVAIVGNVDGERRLVVLDAALKPVVVAGVGKVKVRGIEWAGDQFVLVHYSQTVSLGIDFTTSKAELGSVLVVPVDGGKAWAVFAQVDSITGGVQGTYGVVQRSGRWYGYFGGVTVINAGSGNGYLPGGTLLPDIYEVDLQTRTPRKVAHRPDGEGEMSRDWLLDGGGAVGASLDLMDRSGEWSVHNAQHKTLASGVDTHGRVSLIDFTPDGASVIYSLHDGKDGLTHWYSVPLAGGTPVPYLDDESVKSTFEDRGHHIIGYTSDAAGNESHFFDSRQEKIYKASQHAFPGLHMTLIDHNDAFDRLLVTTEGPGDPVTWWLVDIKTGNAEQLGQSYPMHEEDVGPMKMVPYAAADGLKMEGVLTLPPAGLLQGRAAKSLPAVVLPHGGPFGIYDTAGFDWIAQAFASRGYAVFQPNFRGSGGYGDTFRQAGHGEYGRKMQSDISDGLSELVRQGVVDPKRVCIVGASYGGYAALAGVTLQQGLYACAVSYAGMSDLAEMVNSDLAASDHNPMLYRNLNEEVGQGRSLKEVSPIRFVDKVSVPILLIHGKNDTVVNFSQSTAMADALRRAGKQVEFVTLPGEDHWLSGSETRLAMLQASVDFVMKHNPPDPGK